MINSLLPVREECGPTAGDDCSPNAACLSTEKLRRERGGDYPEGGPTPTHNPMAVESAGPRQGLYATRETAPRAALATSGTLETATDPTNTLVDGPLGHRLARLADTLITPDERRRLEVIVPDPLVRAEVMAWLETARMQAEVDALLFLGHVRPSVEDGELLFALTETGRDNVERRRRIGGAR